MAEEKMTVGDVMDVAQNLNTFKYDWDVNLERFFDRVSDFLGEMYKRGDKVREILEEAVEEWFEYVDDFEAQDLDMDDLVAMTESDALDALSELRKKLKGDVEKMEEYRYFIEQRMQSWQVGSELDRLSEYAEMQIWDRMVGRKMEW